MQSKAFDKKKKLEIKSRKLEIDEHFLNLLRSIYKEIKNHYKAERTLHLALLGGTRQKLLTENYKHVFGPKCTA